MRKVLVAVGVLASLMSVTGCMAIGKGKGKGPEPVMAEPVTK